MFDLSTLPEGAVSADLFAERTLVERSAFMAAQLQAMEREAASLRESGWREVLVGKREDLHDRPLTMDVPDREYDEATTRAIEKLEERRSRWEAKLEEVPDDDERALEKIQSKLDELETAEQELTANAPSFFSEATKSNSTVFLMLHPDGQVRREERIPRERRKGRTAAMSNGDTGGRLPASTALTSESLSERQLADLFTHQTLAVRAALLKAPAVRKRVLALILHPKIRSEALAIRHDANAVTLHAQGDGFSSTAMEHLTSKRKSLDPFVEDHHVADDDSFERLLAMPDASINQLIDVLVVDCLTAHLQRQTAFVAKLRELLKVDLRISWRPTAPWLASYQKVQLAELMATLHGRPYNPNVKDERKKSQLVEELNRLFAEAAAGTLEDKNVAEHANAWMPRTMVDNTKKQ